MTDLNNTGDAEKNQYEFLILAKVKFIYNQKRWYVIALKGT